MSDRKPLATLDQVAAFTGLTAATLYDQRHRGVGIGAQGIRIGRHLRWRWADIDTWLDSQQPPHAA